MPSLSAYPAFVTGFTLSLTLIIAIGAQNTYVLRQGLRREHIGAVVAICAVLDIVLMTLGVSGLAVSLGNFPRALDALGLAGALALCIYGWMAMRRAINPHALSTVAGGAPVPLMRVATQTILITLLNPHVYLDTVILVGAVGAGQPQGQQAIFLLGAALASVSWFVTLGFGARVLQPVFSRPQAWRVLDGVVALTMWAIALGLVLRTVQP